ncbi:glycosyltransferase [Naasia lichenicola]|uniref:D-inositol 3-phosphate glycosyltransferase n=1 Tax=Naasia lichenicola TaxID=2565933 RepID=A0A4S4FIH8_9MICO|nr:glycosyltransferase [Naasia lichenicola]THG29911.1 glycosyltransferase family 4 protein [Naasia lichenicola]
MRIAVLCHMHHPIAQPFEGGTEAHTATMTDILVARGHDVTLFAKEGSGTDARLHALVPAEFEFIRTASPLVREQQRGFLAEAAHHSIQLIEGGGYDVVINNSLSSLPYRGLRDTAMLTILHTPPTLADVTAVVSSAGWTPGERHAYATVSRANAASWRHLLPSVEVVSNGVDLHRWRPRTHLRRRHALWAARITPEKGLHLAIDAARAAGIALEISGPIAHRAYFDEQIVPRLGADVRYRGHLDHDQLPRFLARGAVFIASPLWAEPFGLSVVEAMACGTPVAALPAGAMPELIAPAAGALAADDSVDALAQAIREALGRSRAAVRSAAAAYSDQGMVDGYERILRRLTGTDDPDRLADPAAAAHGSGDLDLQAS